MTFGFHPAAGEGTNDWRVQYRPTPYKDIFCCLSRIELSRKDVFTDVGCGLGRAVFAASWMGTKRSIGIEVVESLCTEATANHKNSRLANCDIKFVCAHAAGCDLEDTTVLFLANPFGEATMRSMIERIPARTEPLRIAYILPLHEKVLESSGRFRCIANIQRHKPWYSTSAHYRASLWQSTW